LANLLWLRPWALALDLHWNPFFFELGTRVHLVAVVLGVLATGLALWVALRLTRVYEALRALASWGFLFLCAVAANTLRNQVPSLATHNLESSLGAAGLALASLAAIGGISWLAISRRAVLLRILSAGILVLTPLFAFLFIQAAYAALREGQISAPAESTPLPKQAPGPRVVVVLFDEMDRDSAALGTAAAKRSLPSLSRFREESIHFEATMDPVGGAAARTLISVPAMTLGRRVIASEPSGSSEVLLRFSDGSRGVWSQTHNLFRKTRVSGVNTFLAGWYLPYCRLFGAELADCSWRPAYPIRPQSISSSLGRYGALFWTSLPGLNRLSLLMGWRKEDREDLIWHRESYEAIHSRALRGVASANRLVFLHYPVPHLSQKFFGSLAENQLLADRALGELRAVMEAVGTWDTSAVLVLSDHGSRALAGVRHPILMVKPPYSTGGRVVTRPVSLVRVFDLILGLLEGDLQYAEQIIEVVSQEVM